MSDASKDEKVTSKSIFLNVLWVVFAGWWLFILWLVPSITLIFTVIGVPFGLETYKIAKFLLLPFNKEKNMLKNTGKSSVYSTVWVFAFGGLIQFMFLKLSTWIFKLVYEISFGSDDKVNLPFSEKEWDNYLYLALRPFDFEGSPWKATLTKRDLAIYYLSAYILIAYLETLLFTILIGSYSSIDILLNFSIWGITWLVSMFTYPMFFAAANVSKLAVNPYFALIGYVIILVGFYIAFMLHRKSAERQMGKKLSFNKLIDIYFPVRRDSKKEEETAKVKEEVPDKSESKSEAKE